MIDCKIVTFIILYVLSYNLVNDAHAATWDVKTFDNIPLAPTSLDGLAGETLKSLHDNTKVGQSIHAIQIKYSEPELFNQYNQLQTTNFVVYTRADQLGLVPENWTNGDQYTSYWPKPPEYGERYQFTFPGYLVSNQDDAPTTFNDFVEYAKTKFCPTRDYPSFCVDSIRDSGLYQKLNFEYPSYSNDGSYILLTGTVSFYAGGCHVGYKDELKHPDQSHLNRGDYRSTCVLNGAPKQPIDGVCEVRITNNQFRVNINDLDCDPFKMPFYISQSYNSFESYKLLKPTTADKTTYIQLTDDGLINFYEKTYLSQIDTTYTLLVRMFSDQTVNFLQSAFNSGNQTAIPPDQTVIVDNSGGSGGDTSNSDAKLDEIFQDGEIPDENTIADNSVINPFENVFTPLQNYQLPIQAGNCPTVDIEYFDPPVNFGKHCQLFEEHKPTLRNAMALIFMIAGIRIVLSA